MDAARILHFLAVAWLVAHAIGPRSPLLGSRFAWPAILCGRHSLQVFCLGISLSFVAHAVLVLFGRALWQEVLVIASGLALMVAVAATMDWYGRRAVARAAAAEVA